MTNHFENIDRYFGGEMSAEEMQHFESVVTQDPILQKEFSFQQELVEGIQIARKAELKATLANIDVSNLPAGGTSTLTKILGGIAATSIIAIGAYVYLEKENAILPVETESIPEIAQQTVDNNDATLEITEKGKKETVPVVKKQNSSQEVATPIEQDQAKSVTPTVINEANIKEDFEDETEVSEVEAPANHLIAKSKVIHSTLEVSVEENKRYSFHYQVKNNALVLYGNFNSLYEIIEFHKDGNVSTYLKYDEKYYEIDRLQSKATPLVELTGDGLLNLLDSIENNKER